MNVENFESSMRSEKSVLGICGRVLLMNLERPWPGKLGVSSLSSSSCSSSLRSSVPSLSTSSLALGRWPSCCVARSDRSENGGLKGHDQTIPARS